MATTTPTSAAWRGPIALGSLGSGATKGPSTETACYTAQVLRRLTVLAVLFAPIGCSLFASVTSPVGEGEGEAGGAPTIIAIDGDGLDAPPTDPSGVTDFLHAAHRFRGDLLVSGERLDRVSTAHLASDDTLISLEILEMTSPNSRRFRLASAVAPGLFTLVLASTAGEARAQAFLLQGEPGLNNLVEVRDATPQECPVGGTVTRSGLDTNRDGVLDDEGVDGAPVCASAILAPRTFAVADETALRSVLTELFRVSIAAPVTIALPQRFDVTDVVVISHPDGRYLSIVGPASGSTDVTSHTSEAFRVLNGGATLRRLNFIATDRALVAINVGFAANATLEDVRVTGFRGDAILVTGGTVVFNGVTLVDNKRGLLMQGGGRGRHQHQLTVTSSTISDAINPEGVRVAGGSQLELVGATIRMASGTALAVVDGGVVVANGSDLGGEVVVRAATMNLTEGSFGTLNMRDNGNAIITNSESTSSSTENVFVTRGSTLRMSGGSLRTSGGGAISIASSEGAVVTATAPHICSPAATAPGLCTVLATTPVDGP